MKSLSNKMDFDHVIQVHEDGSVTDAPDGLYAPELYEDELSGDGWEFFSTGYTGQYGYAGPIMHSSEYIGGQLALDILATPGYFVSVVAYFPNEDENDSEHTVAEGWAIAYRPVS